MGTMPVRVAIGAMILLLGAGASLRAEEAPHCIVPPPPGVAQAFRSTLRAADGSGLRARVPASGNVHLLVLLAEFSDLPHGTDPSRFETLLFGAGTSLRQYYLDASDGALSLTGDVHGWYTLPSPLALYSGGANGVGAYPNNAQRMAEDALSVAVGAGLDLGDYDADGDGEVDALLVVHSGQGSEWAASAAATPVPEPTQINSHKWVVRQADYGSGARVVDYFTCPELQRVKTTDYPAWSDSLATVGVFCHEFGHMLGLPDYYDTQTLESRVGVWEVMDAGLWKGDPSVPGADVLGSLPGRFSPFSRATLGWATPVSIAPPVGESAEASVSVASAHAGSPGLQLLVNPYGFDWQNGDPGRGEYFLAEVRTSEGWDAGLPTEGLILYHIDEAASSNRASQAPTPGGALIELVPADGIFELNTTSGDPWGPFPARFDATTNPSSRFFDGRESGVSLNGIGGVVGGSVALDVSVVNLNGALAPPFARPHPFRPSVHGSTDIVLGFGETLGPSSVRIHDVAGRLVRTLDGASVSANGRVATWDGRGRGGEALPAGVYFFRIEGSAPGTGRVLLLR
jgi:immune inhibitor A